MCKIHPSPLSSASSTGRARYVGLINRPQRNELLIRAAGISLDGALFPLLVGIERFGPIGVVDLADRVGRDYTTVSRQVARLEGLDLGRRRSGTADRRVREAAISPKGKAMTDLVDTARESVGLASSRHGTRATSTSWCA
jgi:DNA-binding MarR family transcriptional regulator